MEKNQKNILIIVVSVILVLTLFVGFGTMNPFGGNIGSGFGLSLGIVSFICAIWVICDVLAKNKGLSDGMKLLWIVGAILFSIITAIIYYLVGRNNQNDLFKK